MTSDLSRRGFLGAAAAGGLGIAFAGSIDAIAGTAAHTATRSGTGYGPLVADQLLALPEGFSYKVVAQAGVTKLVSGEFTPDDADGTASFALAGGFTLVNNHEIGGSEEFGVPTVAGLTYDPGARGGTTNIDVTSAGERVREYVGVAGTHNNCAGGLTPWGTWLTCEETEAKAGFVTKAESTLLKDHGYVFEVSPAQDENTDNSPVPLRFLGRFAHEAVAVDPATNVIYETEDSNEPHGGFYRWTPPAGFTGSKGALHALAGNDAAGALEAMSCARGSKHIEDLSQATRPGTQYKVTWVTVPDRLATETSVRKQFSDDQVTRSRKLEGAWYGDGGIYFVASFAREKDGSVNEHDGQVWFYDPAKQTVKLMTIFGVNLEPDVDTDNYDGPDNITVSPYGGVILAEDATASSTWSASPHKARATRWPATSWRAATSSPARTSAPTGRSCSPTSSRPVTSSRSPDRGGGRATLADSSPCLPAPSTVPWRRRCAFRARSAGSGKARDGASVIVCATLSRPDGREASP